MCRTYTYLQLQQMHLLLRLHIDCTTPRLLPPAYWRLPHTTISRGHSLEQSPVVHLAAAQSATGAAPSSPSQALLCAQSVEPVPSTQHINNAHRGRAHSEGAHTQGAHIGRAHSEGGQRIGGTSRSSASRRWTAISRISSLLSCSTQRLSACSMQQLGACSCCLVWEICWDAPSVFPCGQPTNQNTLRLSCQLP